MSSALACPEDLVVEKPVSPSEKFGREVVQMTIDYYRHRFGALDCRSKESRAEDKQLFRLCAVIMRREGQY